MESTVGELRSSYAKFPAEFRARGVERSAKAPAGNDAEALCSRPLNAALVHSFSVESHYLAPSNSAETRTW